MSSSGIEAESLHHDTIPFIGNFLGINPAIDTVKDATNATLHLVEMMYLGLVVVSPMALSIWFLPEKFKYSTAAISGLYAYTYMANPWWCFYTPDIFNLPHMLCVKSTIQVDHNIQFIEKDRIPDQITEPVTTVPNRPATVQTIDGVPNVWYSEAD